MHIMHMAIWEVVTMTCSSHINQVQHWMIACEVCVSFRVGSTHNSIIPLNNQCQRSKPLTFKILGKVDLIDFHETPHFISLIPIITPLLLSLSWFYLSFRVPLNALLSHTLPKPNPDCDYHIMLLPYYQNGADLGFVVVKD